MIQNRPLSTKRRKLIIGWKKPGDVSVFMKDKMMKVTGKGLVQYVIKKPLAIQFIRPIFASLTEPVFKEGLCYGKIEVVGLALIIPTLFLGHLTGLMDDQFKLRLLRIWMSLFTIFTANKFSKSIKDDIDNKLVFMFNALSKEEKAVFPEEHEEAVVEKDLQETAPAGEHRIE